MVDFHDIHLKVLPKRLSGERGRSAAALARELSPLCIRIKGTDNAYTYRPQAFTIEVVAGTEADVVLNVSLSEWEQIISAPLAADDLMDAMESEAVIDKEFLSRWRSVFASMFNGVTE